MDFVPPGFAGGTIPSGTGMELDCAFYLDEHARDYRAALVEGEAAADAFLERTAPDLGLPCPHK